MGFLSFGNDKCSSKLKCTGISKMCVYHHWIKDFLWGIHQHNFLKGFSKQERFHSLCLVQLTFPLDLSYREQFRGT